jgi:hypothetical protein
MEILSPQCGHTKKCSIALKDTVLVSEWLASRIEAFA